MTEKMYVNTFTYIHAVQWRHALFEAADIISFFCSPYAIETGELMSVRQTTCMRHLHRFFQLWEDGNQLERSHSELRRRRISVCKKLAARSPTRCAAIHLQAICISRWSFGRLQRTKSSAVWQTARNRSR
jgi:hypothetical protein